MKNKQSTCLIVFGTFLFILYLQKSLTVYYASNETFIFAGIGAALAVWGLLIRK